MRLNTIAVRKQMLEQDLSVKDAADAIGISVQAFYDWMSEGSFPSPANLGKLMLLLGISADELLIVDAEAKELAFASDKHNYEADGRGDESL